MTTPDLCQGTQGKKDSPCHIIFQCLHVTGGLGKAWPKLLDANEHSRLQLWKLIWKDRSWQSMQSVI